MLKRLAQFFSPEPADADAPSDADERLRLAAAALLVEAAIIDGHFDERERATIRTVLCDRFDLGEDEVDTLLEDAEAEVAESVQLFRFTRVIAETLENEDRVAIVEMLWDVAFADGHIDDYEAALARRVAGMLHVSDRDHAHARQAARERALGSGAESDSPS